MKVEWHTARRLGTMHCFFSQVSCSCPQTTDKLQAQATSVVGAFFFAPAKTAIKTLSQASL